jgi:hypothetical protein
MDPNQVLRSSRLGRHTERNRIEMLLACLLADRRFQAPGARVIRCISQFHGDRVAALSHDSQVFTVARAT